MSNFIEKKLEWFIIEVLGPKLSFILGVIGYYLMFSYLVYASFQQMQLEVYEFEKGGRMLQIMFGIFMMVIPLFIYYLAKRYPAGLSDYSKPDISEHPTGCQCWDCHPWA